MEPVQTSKTVTTTENLGSGDVQLYPSLDFYNTTS